MFSLGLIYNINFDFYVNYLYWFGLEILNVIGVVIVVFDDIGSFKIVYGEFFIGVVYVYKNLVDENWNYNKSSSNFWLMKNWV